jgi:hypothetical protein
MLHEFAELGSRARCLWTCWGGPPCAGQGEALLPGCLPPFFRCPPPYYLDLNLSVYSSCSCRPNLYMVSQHMQALMLLSLRPIQNTPTAFVPPRARDFYRRAWAHSKQQYSAGELISDCRPLWLDTQSNQTDLTLTPSWKAGLPGLCHTVRILIGLSEAHTATLITQTPPIPRPTNGRANRQAKPRENTSHGWSPPPARATQSILKYIQSKSRTVYVTIELLVSPARHILNIHNKSNPP